MTDYQIFDKHIYDSAATIEYTVLKELNEKNLDRGEPNEVCCYVLSFD